MQPLDPSIQPLIPVDSLIPTPIAPPTLLPKSTSGLPDSGLTSIPFDYFEDDTLVVNVVGLGGINPMPVAQPSPNSGLTNKGDFLFL
jgi:hypothetical protein